MQKLKSYHGTDFLNVATVAAREACTRVLKEEAKDLATRMESAALKQGTSSETAVSRSIQTILQVGRPMEAGIIQAAAQLAISKTRSPELPSTVKKVKKALSAKDRLKGQL